MPENWVDFVDVAKFFTKGESLYGTVFAGKEEALTGRFYEILTSLGGNFISANSKSDFNSEKGVEAVSILKELYGSNSMPKDMINYLWDDVAHNFVDGRIAFYLDYYNWYTYS
ncbi:hypothetical protein G9F72_006735 [Clostridium estertheticum]|uniref:hypothetical protein n=1 Tax=Clostridium estertheticum TaxID=238834 RepID=UPI0013E92FC1|nr:hypothetical protein [Clostridium estertheticum]MBZ9686029.1 hypothetical protein [Clostridium estertheticum]